MKRWVEVEIRNYWGDNPSDFGPTFTITCQRDELMVGEGGVTISNQPWLDGKATRCFPWHSVVEWRTIEEPEHPKVDS